MKINLSDSINNRKVILNLFKSYGIIHDKNSKIFIIEKNKPLPDDGIKIIFDPANLDQLMEFLEYFKKSDIKTAKEFVIGKKKESYELLRYENILFFESFGNFIFCQTKEKKIEVNKKLYEIENDLAEKGFIRVNKSFIVNILNVCEIIPWFGGKLLLKFNGVDNEIEVSRNYTGQFKKFLGF